jgi:3-dehydroquinate dehydratase-2
VETREPWRRHSVISDLCTGRVTGKGADGYRDALMLLQTELGA